MSRSTRRLLDYLQDIIYAAERIEAKTRPLSRDDFFRDEDAQDIVIRQFENMGEAANNISTRYPQFVAEHPELQLSEAYKMRNRLAHGYHGVKLSVVWMAAQSSAPVLCKQVKEIVRTLANES